MTSERHARLRDKERETGIDREPDRMRRQRAMEQPVLDGQREYKKTSESMGSDTHKPESMMKSSNSRQPRA
eukprot:CAMPEP_0115883992 /NCGR_PEP_ID=MMETSP0287-20121206/29874_1 /TAXON_ID=412157 /ORGANISM="Chrysochromulina rotalis, Strain UIO044" /LENGTH=70 /DNA_ID=CAMNT_0003340255 /DNA_START=350 /DNA_END=559 /DNA_ORIENTATION=+